MGKFKFEIINQANYKRNYSNSILLSINPEAGAI